MKFLLIVLVIHFIVEMIAKKREKRSVQDDHGKIERTVHPAEFDLR